MDLTKKDFNKTTQKHILFYYSDIFQTKNFQGNEL